MNIGIFLPNWIGDVVMATPAIRALRKISAPEGRIVGIMRPYVAEVLAGTTWLDQQLLYDKPRSPMRTARSSFSRKLRAAQLDRVVLLTNSWRTAWIAWRSSARERIGYAQNGRGWLLTKRLRPPRFANGRPLPTIDSYLQLSEAAGAAPEAPIMELATTPVDEQMADQLWQQLNLPPGNEVVLLNSGSAYGAAKLWPVEYFAALARRIVHDLGLHVLVNCGPGERAVAREITQRANHPYVVSLADVADLPLGLTKACVRRVRLVATTDSGPRFMAIAFRKPVVSLFGPTDPAATATHYHGEICLSRNLNCQPCMARRCPLNHHRCMRDLTVEHVFSYVEKLVNVEVGSSRELCTVDGIID